MDKRQEYGKQQERFKQRYQRVTHERNTISRQDPHGGRLLKKKMKAVKSLEKRCDRESENMTKLPESEDAIMISFDDNTYITNGKNVVSFALATLYVKDNKLSENIKLEVKGTEHLRIIGKNGTGKTTLLKII